MIGALRRAVDTAREVGSALVALLAACGGVHADTVPEATVLDGALVGRIESAIERTMKDNHIPGLAAGIVWDGQAVYGRGFGLADLGTGRRVTSRTVFQLGSDSKMMVGIAVMQLSVQGRIELDAPVTTYLPYFRLADERYTGITIRQLLSHRSGLPWCANYALCGGEIDYRTPEFDAGSLERHVRNLGRVRLGHPPGETMQYSDLGFEILGDVIAKVSGQTFEAYIREHVFAPLGMRRSTFLLRDVPPQLLAAPHVLSPGPAVNEYFPYTREHAPSSHLFSNVDDMNRFAVALLARGQEGMPQILPQAAYDTMWTSEIATNMPSKWEKTLGLGWFLGGEPGHRLIGHAGGDTGFDSEFILAPDDGLAVVMMINVDYILEGFSFQVMQWLMEAKQDRRSRAN